MTHQQRKDLTWPLVAIVGLGLAFLLGVFVAIPKDMPEARTALLGVMMTGIGTILATLIRQLDRKVEDQPSSHVSRETSGRHAARGDGPW